MKKTSLTIFYIGLFLLSSPIIVWGDSLNVRTIGICNILKARGFALSGSYAYVASEDLGLRIVNISDPSNPSVVGSYDTPGMANGVAVSGNYAYVADGLSGLKVIDVSVPSNPQLVGGYDTPGNAVNIAVSGNYAYVAEQYNGLQIIDIGNPTNPQPVRWYITAGEAYNVTIAGNYAYVADYGSGLAILNISNPASPQTIGTYDTQGNAHGVAASGNYAYVADQTAMRIFNVTNPATPLYVGVSATQFARAVCVFDRYAFVAESNYGLRIFDVTNPSSLQVAGYYDTPGTPYNVSYANNCAYVTDYNSGLRIIDCSQVNGNQPNPTSSFLTFTGTPVAQYDSLLLTISNRNHTEFRYNTLVNSNTNFFSYRVDDSDSVTNANDSLRIWVRFNPDSTNIYRDTLRMTFDTPFQPITVPISGTGIGTYSYLTQSTIVFPNSVEPTLRDSMRVQIRVAGNLPLSNVALISDAPFDFSGNTLPLTQAGDAASIWLRFQPTAPGTFVRNLPIVVNTINVDTLWITASGTSSYVPAAPGSLTISLAGENADLTWARVDTSQNGVPLTIQRYLVFYRNDNTTPWYYLWNTAGADATSFTHIGVSRFSPAMFYQVKAWIGDSDTFDQIVQPMSVGTLAIEVERRLSDTR
ncbi:MAG: hypothetical protein OEM52_05510 [bacterium]|nr:hypothetical protein [bacterium]